MGYIVVITHVAASLQCPLCLGSGEAFHSDARREYLRCATCALVFVPAAYHISPDEERSVYELHENSPDDLRYRAFLSRSADAVRARVPPGSDGLDFGCGPGPTLSVMLEEQGYRMSVYDPFFAPDASVLRRRYDFLTATEVVEHLREPARTLRRMWSLVRPGGHLVVMTKMVRSKDAFARWHYKDDETHVVFFSRETFAWLAALVGTEVDFVGADVVVVRRPGYS